MALLPAQVMDHGYPQFTEAKILSEYIKTDAHKMEVRAVLQLLCWQPCSVRLTATAVATEDGSACADATILPCLGAGAGAAAHGGHECGVLAQRRPQVSEHVLYCSAIPALQNLMVTAQLHPAARVAKNVLALSEHASNVIADKQKYERL